MTGLVALLVFAIAFVAARRYAAPLGWRLFIAVQRRRGNVEAVRWAESRVQTLKR